MPDTVSYAWAPITKSEKQDDGTLIVHGPAASSALDRDSQRLDATWLDSAMPRWLAEGGGVREQHDSKRAVGVGVGLSKGDDGAHYLTARIVDPVAIKKIEHGVLRGFSVGIKNPRVEMGKADAPNGLVTAGDVIEVSVVDRPANGECLFQLAKADGDGHLAPVEDAEVIETPAAPAPAEPAAEAVEPQPAEPAEAPAAAEATTPAVPAVAPEVVLQAAQVILDARALTKADDAGEPPAQDAITADTAIACIAQLIISEAESLAKGNLNEACDIALLLEAVRALQWFKLNEECEEMDAQMALADTTKADAPEPATPAAPPQAAAPQTPAATPEFMTKADVTDLVKSAVAEAATVSKERIDALETDLAKAHGELDAIKAQPLPGGPVLTRTATQQDQARTSDSQRLRAEAAQLMAKADAVSDRTLRDGYRERAHALLLKADA